MAQAPVLSKKFGRLSGDEAWRQNLDLATMSAAKTETSFGPRGAYKMVAYNRGPEKVVKVTKDAVEVLNELEVQYPAVKTIAEAARLQREQAGDGVSAFVILLAGLLKEARAMMDHGLHPTVILRGYHDAAREALLVVDAAAHAPGSDATERLLRVVDCGRGIISGGLLLAVSEAAERARSDGGIDFRRIRLAKKSGKTASDSVLIRGVLIRKAKAHPGMPDSMDAAKVAVVSRKLDVRPVESLMKGKGPFSMKLRIEPGDIEKFKDAEKELRKEIADAVLASGADVVICRSKIAEEVADRLARGGVLAFDMVDEGDVEAAAEATGAVVVGDVKDIREGDLGFTTRVERQTIDGIEHVAMQAKRGSTIVLRGSSEQELQESERVVRSAITVLRRAQKDPRLVPGGGAAYMQVAGRARELALRYASREQMAVQAFADAIERIPECLAANYGLGRAMVMAELRGCHARGPSTMGIGRSGCAPMDTEGIEELALITKSVIHRAVEVATLLLRIDDYFYVKELPLVHKK